MHRNFNREAIKALPSNVGLCVQKSPNISVYTQLKSLHITHNETLTTETTGYRWNTATGDLVYTTNIIANVRLTRGVRSSCDEEKIEIKF
jgi:hypothetical protein